MNTAIKHNTDNTRINGTTISRKQKWEEKQLIEYFMRQTNEIVKEKNWTRLKKRNVKRETESLLISAQSNAIRNN